MSETIETDDWWKEIVRQIEEAPSFIFLFTDDWQKSPICRREYQTAQSLEKTIIPVQIEEFDIVSDLRYIPQKYQISKLFERDGRAQFILRLETASRANQYSPEDGIADARLPAGEILETLKRRLAEKAEGLRVLGSGDPVALKEVFQQLALEPSNAAEDPLTVGDVLQRTTGGRTIILGLPGSGKSTLIQYAELSLASRAGPVVPIRQSATDLAKRDGDLSAWLSDYLAGASSGRISLAAGGRPIAGVDTVVMIDGLDEVREAQSEILARGIRRFSDIYPEASIILTSRVGGINLDDFPGYQVLRIQGLTDQDIRKYVEATVPADHIERVWAIIISSPELNDLCRTPFILAMICAAHSELGGRAAQRATIYRRCVGYLLREADWQSGRGLSSEQEAEELRRALRFLAIRFFKLDSSDSFRESELLETIKLLPGFENDAGRLLHRIVHNTGLLQPDRDGYQFVHRTIWEYFVAEGCRDEPLENLVERANARHWEEPLRLFAGLIDENQFDHFVRRIWTRNTGLSIRMMTELAEMPRDTLESLYDSCSKLQKISIVQELRSLGSLLDDKKRKSKLLCDTISVLARIETSSEFIFYFIELLEDDHSTESQELVARILDEAGGPDRLTRYLGDTSFSLDFADLQGGTFLMGVDCLPDGRMPDASECPAHEVRLSPFSISTSLVTNKLFYDAFPYAHEHRDLYSMGDDQPANYVTWFEAKIFSRWLGCDLPTDAQWEFAARSGGADDAALFDRDQLPDYAWHGENSGNTTHPVKTKKPNSFGLYDVAGNLREWCEDWFDPAFYEACGKQGLVVDPVCDIEGDRKVLRGGTFDWAITHLHPTYRNANVRDTRNQVTGFRLARRKF